MSTYLGSTKIAGNSAVHTHTNKNVIDKFSEVSGNPYYNGSPIGGSDVEDLTDLDDVVITSPVDYQVLCYDATSGKWKNQGVSGAQASIDGSTLVLSGNSYTVSGNTLVIS